MNSEAIIYACQKIYEIEFSNKIVSENNPYKILPVALDPSVDKWIRDLFANVEYTKIPWSSKGISTLKIGNTFEFKFNRNGCELLDCFGYRDLYGNECNYYGPRNVQLDFNFNKVIAGRPPCFQVSNRLSILAREKITANDKDNTYNYLKYKPTHEYVYYDEDTQKCRNGLEQFRRFCLFPYSRGGYKEIEGDYSFYWNEAEQNCEITEDYCKAYKGESYSNGDCHLSAGQSVLEFLFGKVIVRNIKLRGYRKIPLRKKQRVLKNNKLRINGKTKLDTEWQYIPEEYSTTFAYTHMLKNVAEQVAQLGYYFGAIALMKIGNKSLKALADMIELSTRNLIEHEVVGTAFHLGLHKVTSFITLKAATILAAKVAVQSLEIAANLLNPAMYLIDVISIAGLVLDFLPNKYTNIFTKKEMNMVREQFVKKFNEVRKIKRNDSEITLLEVLPENIYIRLFGLASSLDTSRYSNNYIKTFYYFIDEYNTKVNYKYDEKLFTDNMKFEVHHFNNVLSVFKRNMLSDNFIAHSINEKYSDCNKTVLGNSLKRFSIVALFAGMVVFAGIQFTRVKNNILSSYIFPILLLCLFIFLYNFQCNSLHYKTD